VSARELKSSFNYKNVHLLNDFEANAYGLLTVEPQDLIQICGNQLENHNGVKIVLGPGTGIGVLD
jgi:glucokinase